MFVDLPAELALEVFRHLPPPDAAALLAALDQFRPHPNAARYSDLVYTRLYSGHMVVSVSEVTPPVYDVRVTPQQFEECARSARFRAQAPRVLDLIFVRSLRDYAQFQAALAALRAGLDSPHMRDWLARVGHVSFQLNGRSTADYAPTLLLALVIQTMVTLAAVHNLRTLKINSTDIGLCFPDKWGAVFAQYRRLTTLTLSDNILRLGLQQPLLETHFRWPPALRVLALNKNLLSAFTCDAVARLPKSLVHLDLSGNRLTSFAEPPHMFAVADMLPNLRFLNLSFNTYLVRVNPHLLSGAAQMRHTLAIHLDGCNIVDRRSLKLRARAERVKLHW